MLKWAIIFLIIALVAGALGFSGVAAGAKTISLFLFGLFFVLFLVVLIFGVMLGMLAF
jgi:uncharacterized membrane protein YtjA (UPF0391 family)